MIVRMKKLTLLISEKEKGNFVSDLRKAGVVHIKHVKLPEAHDITYVEDKISNINKMISILSPYAEEHSQRELVCKDEEILSNGEKIEEACKEKEELSAYINTLKRQGKWFDAWGQFDPKELEAFRAKGINVRLYRLRKDEFKKAQKEMKCQVIGKEKGHILAAAVSVDQQEEIPYHEIIPPAMSPDEIEEEIDKAKNKIVQIESFLKTEAEGLGSLRICRQKYEKELTFLNVKFGMQVEDRFAYLQGFCPEKETQKVIEVTKKYGAGYIVDEPDNPEETPTLVTNPKWIRIINPVFRFMNTLPGYNEFDISFYFLVFFSLFFAMLIGDAGYGILFLIATFLIRRRLKHLPWEPFFLMYLLSAGTIVWGAITGTWFGAERIAQLPFLNGLVVGKINSFADNNQNFLIYICFLIGATQLTIAHLLRAVRVINSILSFAQFGWILILWGMFFAAGKFVIGNVFPPFAGWLLIMGIGLVLFCSNPQKGIFKGALITLAELPLSVIGSFSDIVSYLRLFAVGYATVVVAESFNNMALAGGVHSVIGGISAALILFFGHMLNITLGFMAVIVHGIRLNMLEFSSHLGMQWSGKKYEPFCEE